MRYTTIIDITEYPVLYRNHAVRLVYLHLVLRSGYHDHDRDLCDTSIRRIAFEVGLSIAAVRHALHMLQRHALVQQLDGLYQVTKWTVQTTPTKRAKTAAQTEAHQAQVLREAQQIQRERLREQEKADRERLRAQGKTQYMLYVEELKRKAEAGDKNAERLYNSHKASYEESLTALQGKGKE